MDDISDATILKMPENAKNGPVVARMLSTEQLTIIAGDADRNRREMRAGVVYKGAKVAAVSRTAENM
jgi:hypothetical protein